MKYLIIDDLAEKGWKSVIECAVIKEKNSLEVAIDFEDAIKKLDKKWDLIFLDMRLSEVDHTNLAVNEYSGFKILKKIKESFTAPNFSTPVILITASNKIWNIGNFQENGIDGYYIKEHPDFHFSEQYSKENLENLQTSFKNNLQIGNKRKEVWVRCNAILSSLNKHKYFNIQDSRYQNIKFRIEDKIKLGYNQLFKKQSYLEREVLLADNESLSFIIFWSILEEISKGFTDIKETWNDIFERKSNWKFRNNEYFIEYNHDKSNYQVNYDPKTKSKNFISEDSRYGSNMINLSEQIYALLHAYFSGQTLNQLKDDFREINRFRNEVDFIHSSINNLVKKKLIEVKQSKQCYEMNIRVLDFLLKILSQPIK